MTGSEKIINMIKADGEAEIAAIKAEAKNKAAQIKKQAQMDAQAAAEKILDEANEKSALMLKSAQSSCELVKRNAMLLTRRNEIDKTISSALDLLYGQSDAEYFSTLISLASKLSGKSGVLCLNQKDLNRVPNDFADALLKVGVNATLSTEPCDIDGGFILKCADIEYRTDFKAILEEKREAVEDLINRELFK